MKWIYQRHINKITTSYKPIYLLVLGVLAFLLVCIAKPAWAQDSVTKSVHKDGKYPTYPTLDLTNNPEADLIKKGEYLAKAGDCIACHTNTHDSPMKPFAGGLPIKMPFGTIYTPNITPDKATGIGDWTDKQFIKAMHEGISPSGHYYFPAFPYIYFNKLSDDDLLAIKTYLFALPAINQKDKPVDMPIPFRWRFLQLGWRLMFFEMHKGQFKPNPRKPAQWNRGAYLVQGLGHCSMCHTPMNFLGAPKRKYYLTGGMVGGYYAPNITSTNLKNTPIQDIVNVFLTDKLIGGTAELTEPMKEVDHDSLKYLSDQDLQAIAMYLKTVRSTIPKSMKVAKGAGAGKSVYVGHCAACHTTGSGGAPKLGDSQAWAPRIKLGLNRLYNNALHGIGDMPAKGACMSCTTKEIQEAVRYMVDKSKGAGTQSAEVIRIGKPPAPPTLAEGKTVYDKVCSVCHNDGALGAPKLGDKTVWAPLIKQNMNVLIMRAIHGYKSHPAMGACYTCTDGDIIAAVKYMVSQSKTGGNYTLW